MLDDFESLFEPESLVDELDESLDDEDDDSELDELELDELELEDEPDRLSFL